MENTARKLKIFLRQGDNVTQKSYDGSPILYLIPTPIGNFEDITYRAINILKEVEIVFAEDTRVTGKLFQHFDIHKKLYSNYEYNEDKNIEKCLKYLEKGYNVGVVSDRGTPVISDPGYGLVKAAIEHGYNVVALPGPTALIPALITSGIEPKPFTFYGFLNSKASKRKQELEKLKNINHTIIFYESPHRVKKTLEEMLEVFGERKICISREISKRYEEIYRGNITNVMQELDNVKGELVIVVEGNKKEVEYSDDTIIDCVNKLVNNGLSIKEAMKIVAKERGVSKSYIYSQYHKLDE